MSSLGPIGIDFGTTKTTMAYAEPQGGKPLIQDSFPTAVYFPDKENGHDGQPLIGNEALKESLTKSWTKFKLEMGCKITPRYCREEPWDLGVDCPSPQHLAALIFRRLYERIKEATGISDHEIGPVTISVPAESTFRQRQAVIFSAVVAGFKDISIIEEPVAAFLMHYYARPAIFKEKNRSLVIDFGGGTCDLALIESRKGQIPLVLSTRTVKLGGNNIDDAIIGYWKKQQRLGKLDQSSNKEYPPDVRQALKQIALKSKESCNPRPSQSGLREMLLYPRKTQVNASVPEDKNFVIVTSRDGKIAKPPLTPQDFDSIMIDILSQIKRELSILLPSEEDKKKIDHIVLAGGSSYVRQVIEFIHINFPDLVKNQDKIEQRILFDEPDSAIAFGALEYQRNRSEGKQVIHPVLPMSTYLQLDYDHTRDITETQLRMNGMFNNPKLIRHNKKSYLELAQRGEPLKENLSIVNWVQKAFQTEKAPLLTPFAGAKVLYIPICSGTKELIWRIFQVRTETGSNNGNTNKDYIQISEETEPIDEIRISIGALGTFLANISAVSLTYAFDIYGDFYRWAHLSSAVKGDRSSQHIKNRDFDWRNKKTIKDARDEYFGIQAQLGEEK